MAAIRNQRAGSTETVTLSSCRNKLLSSLILKPRRMESSASCRTSAGAPASSSLGPRDANYGLSAAREDENLRRTLAFEVGLELFHRTLRFAGCEFIEGA